MTLWSPCNSSAAVNNVKQTNDMSVYCICMYVCVGVGQELSIGNIDVNVNVNVNETCVDRESRKVGQRYSGGKTRTNETKRNESHTRTSKNDTTTTKTSENEKASLSTI
mmetsp:Transcript_18167/g.19999  ORF Transcript_18167/g.19999 Transcript_18167/m.19999 type:complete len:109 (-) Transcript_18167:476-802(-)